MAGSTVRRALVLTVSDGVAHGARTDGSGDALAGRLAALGFAVSRAVVADEIDAIRGAIGGAAASVELIVTTGGTGLTPRDVTPQATGALLDYEIPGIPEAMRDAGRRSTPMASLGRGVAGVIGRTLVVNVPGSPRGATESFDAIAPILAHALDTLSGPFDHETRRTR